MSKLQDITLLATTANATGDLFTRLVSDLFYSLGYDGLRFDVHKTGREIDIEGKHRHEPRRVIAECKAHQKKMGGADLNKFLGAVTRERLKSEQVVGYFISLAGFSESGIEQEIETSEQHRIITMNSAEVIHQLTNSKMLVPLEKASESAGRCAQYAQIDGELSTDGTQLFGHDIGYVWALYYSHGKHRTHVALIHADGTPLANEVAEKIIQADRDCGGCLDGLQYISPTPRLLNREELSKEAMDKYSDWLVAECGYIQLDGLPADTDLSALRMRLERLYVPMKVQYAKRKEKHETINVGDLLKKQSRFSILAKPGGGKSTLIKRLAVAYIDQSRFDDSDDALPKKEWMPLFLRCRELRDRVNKPIRELLTDLGQQAEMNSECSDAFRGIVDESLKNGRVLLLVDGLDEFSDAGDRTMFASHLRTFLAMFPSVALVVTSREAGFRQIASVVDSICDRTTMAPFNKEDVYSLCERWHKEVVGDTEVIRADSIKLSATIWNNGRIRVLAENPLMLTTLLVVRRNVGELPTKRVKLYQAAVDVLVRTWNVEGFDPLDEEETLARLSYIAVAMMSSGDQQIGRQYLLRLLQDAQQELEVELQFSEISPSQFIDRIEYRSSLLMQTGHEEFNGEIQEVFEFRHLTFQEYLAARGIVKDQYPGRDAGQTVPELVRKHLNDESWQEVIPLTAVLAARRDAETLICELAEKCRSIDASYDARLSKKKYEPYIKLLGRCLLDEVLVTPSTLKFALRQVARVSEVRHSIIVEICSGKFGKILEIEVETAYFSDDIDWQDYAGSLSVITEYKQLGGNIELTELLATTLKSKLQSTDRIQKAYASLGIMLLGFEARDARPSEDVHFDERLAKLRDLVTPLLLLQDDPKLNLCSAWALAWTGKALPKSPVDFSVIRRLYWLGRNSEFRELARFASWAFQTQPLTDRDAFKGFEWGDVSDLLSSLEIDPDDTYENQELALVVGWYKGLDLSDIELAKKAHGLIMQQKKHSNSRLIPLRVLRELGETGQEFIESLEIELSEHHRNSEELEILGHYN